MSEQSTPKRRRQNKTAQLQVRISPAMKERVLQKCNEQEIPYSHIVMKALADWLRESSEESGRAQLVA